MRRIAVLVGLLCMALGAQAQRTPVPVANFDAIPVALSTAAHPTAQQVGQAIAVGARQAGWQVQPVGDGELEATFNKADKHIVVVTIRYDADRYSVAFKRCVNMKYQQGELPGSHAYGPHNSVDSTYEKAAAAQRKAFAAAPENAFVRLDPQAQIHPFYERWVFELLRSVRLRLSEMA